VNRFIGVVLTTTCLAAFSCVARADADKGTGAVIDKAIKALGGEEKLGSVKGATWKAKGTITIGGDDNKFTSQTTVQGHDRFRSEFEGEIMGNKISGLTILDGDKGWRKFNDMVSEFDKDAVANEKRTVYLQLIPATILPLKGKNFKVESAGEEKIDDKPAVALKVTGPEGKDFKLYFDKETGLPIKLVAKVVGFQGDEATQETTYGNYKDFDGIKKATKIDIKRSGEKFMSQEVTEFKVLNDVDAKTFAEPK